MIKNYLMIAEGSSDGVKNTATYSQSNPPAQYIYVLKNFAYVKWLHYYGSSLTIKWQAGRFLLKHKLI